MKKFLVSMIFGISLSAIPVSIYACSDLITINQHVHCVLTGSGTTPSGAEICYYSCTDTRNPSPEQPGLN